MDVDLLSPTPEQAGIIADLQGPPSLFGVWVLDLNGHIILRPENLVVEEKGEGGTRTAKIARLREIYQRHPGSSYALYSAYSLACWEAREIAGQKYQKPARLALAAQILESMHEHPMSPALREEVLTTQANLYILLNQPDPAHRCLKRLEAMNPTEPLATRIRELREKLPKSLQQNLDDAT